MAGTPALPHPLEHDPSMTAIRLGLCFLGLGIGLMIAGMIDNSNEDLLHIGGVGCIVFGAVAICIATEAKNNNLPPRQKQAPRTPKTSTTAED